MLRPSFRTCSLLAKRPFMPLTETAHLLASMWATWTPGTIRNRSGIVVAPERRMSSWLITKTAAAVLAKLLWLTGDRGYLDIHQGLK